MYLQLAIPLEKIQDCHLRIAFRHVAKNEGQLSVSVGRRGNHSESHLLGLRPVVSRNFNRSVLASGKDKLEKTFSFAYIKIMQEDGSIIPDGTHDLNMYKVTMLCLFSQLSLSRRLT